MNNLDSLTLKFFCEENADFFKHGTIQKIQMPKRAEILFYIRNKGQNKKFYINIDPKYPHCCFIEDKKDYLVKIPKTPPMFCMQLRKYLEGAQIQDFRLVEYDRILEFYFCATDEFGAESSTVLSVELMGKYSNVILYNKKTKIIIGSCHNVSYEKSSVRAVFGGINYIYPPKQIKKDILKTSYASFLPLKDDIPKNFYYFSIPFFEFLKNKVKTDEDLFNILQNAAYKPDLIKEYHGGGTDFNSLILNYFSKIVTYDIIESKRKKLIKIMNNKIKKLENIIGEEFDTERYERYKRSADKIIENIHLIKQGQKELVDDGVKIKLNSNLTPSQNAQRYYKLYSKLKSAKLSVEKRKREAKEKENYLKGVLFSLENARSLDILDEIEQEIEEYIMQKPSKKQEKINVETVLFKGFEILVGKNNKQNDLIVRKLASSEDIWFHAKGCPSSHIVIKTKNGRSAPPDEIILKAAKITKENSPMKNLSKATIIYTKRKFLKRPPETPLGYVTYREEKEIIV